MTWMLLDSAGNAIADYGDGVAARAALRSLVGEEPAAATEVFLVAYDDAGHAFGPAVMYEDLPHASSDVYGASVALQTATTSVSVATRAPQPAATFRAPLRAATSAAA